MVEDLIQYSNNNYSNNNNNSFLEDVPVSHISPSRAIPDTSELTEENSQMASSNNSPFSNFDRADTPVMGRSHMNNYSFSNASTDVIPQRTGLNFAGGAVTSAESADDDDLRLDMRSYTDGEGQKAGNSDNDDVQSCSSESTVNNQISASPIDLSSDSRGFSPIPPRNTTMTRTFNFQQHPEPQQKDMTNPSSYLEENLLSDNNGSGNIHSETNFSAISSNTSSGKVLTTGGINIAPISITSFTQNNSTTNANTTTNNNTTTSFSNAATAGSTSASFRSEQADKVGDLRPFSRYDSFLFTNINTIDMGVSEYGAILYHLLELSSTYSEVLQLGNHIEEAIDLLVNTFYYTYVFVDRYLSDWETLLLFASIDEEQEEDYEDDEDDLGHKVGGGEDRGIDLTRNDSDSSAIGDGNDFFGLRPVNDADFDDNNVTATATTNPSDALNLSMQVNIAPGTSAKKPIATLRDSIEEIADKSLEEMNMIFEKLCKERGIVWEEDRFMLSTTTNRAGSSGAAEGGGGNYSLGNVSMRLEYLCNILTKYNHSHTLYAIAHGLRRLG
jgi:hypothetical protein